MKHLRAMRTVAPARTFGYWSALADALNQTGQRDEAKAAARKAAEAATTTEERAHAARLAWIASTQIAVRVARDADGKTRMVTTRVPLETTDWNPFIEAGDVVRRASGTLREIDCTGAVTRFLLDTAAGPIAVAITDYAGAQRARGVHLRTADGRCRGGGVRRGASAGRGSGRRVARHRVPAHEVARLHLPSK